MNFDLFLQALIKIGEFKFPKLHPSDALKKLVTVNLMPLYGKIRQSS